MNNRNDNCDLPECIECPSCGCYAFLGGDMYFCDHCGWSCDAEDVAIDGE